jgi:hypothetical protein
MPVSNGNNQITLPDLVRAGDSITAKWANSMRTAIQKLRDRKPQQGKNSKILKIAAPFNPSVKLNGAQWQISASRGLVIEKLSTADETVDALLYWTPSNALTGGLPTWFNINSGQSLFVKVTETNSGTVRVIASVVFEVAASSTISTAYIPGNPSALQDGVYYYEIAAFTVVDTKPVIERWAAASHIYHEVTIAGIYGTYTWTFLDEVTGSESNEMSMEFANGILVASTVTVSGFQTGSGTLDDPYVTQFNARDTDT